MSSQVFTIKCRKCKINTFEINIYAKGATKQICDDCKRIHRSQTSKRKIRNNRAKKIYPKLLVNLTKNYIIFAEGIKK